MYFIFRYGIWYYTEGHWYWNQHNFKLFYTWLSGRQANLWIMGKFYKRGGNSSILNRIFNVIVIVWNSKINDTITSPIDNYLLLFSYLFWSLMPYSTCHHIRFICHSPKKCSQLKSCRSWVLLLHFWGIWFLIFCWCFLV